ncbi:hypothetical protein FNF29_05835 [Cafeteria roenbergensis]|uniref:Uncharacterized protein n=1 Tax=Cafeteria roenbergensis TaxID=33653 RepID=A0A5A8C965_CAFRO|nr:hypothetical protein FNF29_05835 [Cafeteria roenbergensis]|eukprot:KAA0149623.1 hypothetical protein FNF29_05835 [Cafeteria roenbergensis]
MARAEARARPTLWAAQPAADPRAGRWPGPNGQVQRFFVDAADLGAAGRWGAAPPDSDSEGDLGEDYDDVDSNEDSSGADADGGAWMACDPESAWETGWDVWGSNGGAAWSAKSSGAAGGLASPGAVAVARQALELLALLAVVPGLPRVLQMRNRLDLVAVVAAHDYEAAAEAAVAAAAAAARPGADEEARYEAEAAASDAVAAAAWTWSPGSTRGTQLLTETGHRLLALASLEAESLGSASGRAAFGDVTSLGVICTVLGELTAHDAELMETVKAIDEGRAQPRRDPPELEAPPTSVVRAALVAAEQGATALGGLGEVERRVLASGKPAGAADGRKAGGGLRHASEKPGRSPAASKRGNDDQDGFPRASARGKRQRMA